MSNKVCIVIPARLASTRLEGKVIMQIGGKPMLQWVYEAAIKVSEASDVIIATDHNLVIEAAQSFGAKCILTSKSHESGTDRLGEVAKKMNHIDTFINLQADEPLINPDQISELISCFSKPTTSIATQKSKINTSEDLFNFNVVKVVTDSENKALYFSRNAIPAQRDRPYKDWLDQHVYYKHIGLYGYRRETLLEIVALPKCHLEIAESLEQLRWLENGHDITCMETNHYSIGVDTEEDLEKVEEIIQKRKL